MEAKNVKHSPRLYTPWFTEEDDVNEEDSWQNYLRRNMPHPIGLDSPFQDSSWNYTRMDSSFENEDLVHTKSDVLLHQEVMDALYESEKVDASHIKAIVLNGTVSLTGTVENVEEKAEALNIIKAIPDVWKIQNELQIEKLESRAVLS